MTMLSHRKKKKKKKEKVLWQKHPEDTVQVSTFKWGALSAATGENGVIARVSLREAGTLGKEDEGWIQR